LIRVALVDDQALVRLGMRTLIDVEPDLELCGEADDGEAALELIAAKRPDVVLLDVRMPRMDGLEVLRRLDLDAIATRVVILTTFEVDDYVFEALHAGASGFLTKDAEPAELLRAIRVVAAGDSLLSPAVTRLVIERFGRPAGAAGGPAPRVHPSLHLLTEREREIVGWVATGLSNDDIAKALVVSPATVRTHVSRALIKLGARDRAQLVVFADQSGIPVPTLVRPQHPWSYVENESGHPQGTRQRVRHFRARMAAKIASSGDRGHPRGYVSRALRRPA